MMMYSHVILFNVINTVVINSTVVINTVFDTALASNPSLVLPVHRDLGLGCRRRLVDKQRGMVYAALLITLTETIIASVYGRSISSTSMTRTCSLSIAEV
jgi:hypothetical protein